MIKTQYIVAAVALITGTALGFMDIFLFDGKTNSADEAGKSMAVSQTAPRFVGKQMKKELSQITPSLTNMNVLIPQYAEMTAAELKAEIKRLGVLSKKSGSYDDPVNLAIKYLLLRLGRDFPGEVRAFIENELDEGSAPHAITLLQGWGQNDFDGAMAYFLENPARWNFSNYIFDSMVKALAVNDPEKALEWGITQNGKIRQKALFEIFNILVDNHPQKIADFAGKLLPEDLNKEAMLAHISKKWGACDWESAMSWADTLSGRMKKEAVVGILGGLSSVDLEKATEEFKKQPLELQNDIAKAFVDNLSSNDESYLSESTRGRNQALDWILANAPPGESTEKLTRNLFSYSGAITPEFIDRVKNLADGSIRDNALRSIANMTTLMAAYGKFSYEEAFALTDQIKDPKTKKESVWNNVSNWVRDDPESARVWIEEKSGFTEEEKRRQLKDCEESLKFKIENPQEKKMFSQSMKIRTYED